MKDDDINLQSTERKPLNYLFDKPNFDGSINNSEYKSSFDSTLNKSNICNYNNNYLNSENINLKDNIDKNCFENNSNEILNKKRSNITNNTLLLNQNKFNICIDKVVDKELPDTLKINKKSSFKIPNINNIYVDDNLDNIKTGKCIYKKSIVSNNKVIKDSCYNIYKKSEIDLKSISANKRQKIKNLWLKVKGIVRGIISFQKISKNLQLYGTCEDNLENNYKYINGLKKLQSIKVLKSINDNNLDNDCESSFTYNNKNNYSKEINIDTIGNKRNNKKYINIENNSNEKTNNNPKNNVKKYKHNILKSKRSTYYLIKYYLIKKISKCLKLSVINPNSKISLFWNIIIAVFMIYNVTITPYALAFIDQHEFLDELDLIINYFFMFDILLNFNIGITIKGKYVNKRKIIAKEYIKTWFILDVISTFPLSLVIKEDNINNSNRIIRVARISKLSKLSKIFRLLKISRFFKRVAFFNSIQDYFNINYGISRLITFILSFIILSHIVGCMWYFLPPLYDEENNWINAKGLADESLFRKYLFSLYWAFTTITTCGFGDIAAINLLEYIFSLFWVFLGVLFYSFTIGTLSTILVNMNTKENILAQKLNTINLYCSESKLSNDINKEMKRVIIYKNNNNLFSWIEKQEIFNNLPANLKCDVRINSML